MHAGVCSQAQYHGQHPEGLSAAVGLSQRQHASLVAMLAGHSQGRVVGVPEAGPVQGEGMVAGHAAQHCIQVLESIAPLAAEQHLHPACF